MCSGTETMKNSVIIVINGGVAEVSESTKHFWSLRGEQTRCSANTTKATSGIDASVTLSSFQISGFYTFSLFLDHMF